MQTIMIVEDDPDIRDGVRIALDCNRSGWTSRRPT